MKKILFIATTGMTTDGLTAVLLNVARVVAEAYPMGFALGEGSDARFLPEMEKLGEVHQLPSRKRHPLRYLYTLAGIIRRNRYDAVHIHGNSATMALDLFAAFAGGAAVRIPHCHNCARQPWLKRNTLGKICNLLATKPVACSESAGKALYSKPYTVLVNGVSCEKYRFSQEGRESVRGRFQLGDAFVVGHAGRFSSQKNHLRLLKIFAEVLKERPDAVLMLCGDGEEKKECMEIARQTIPSGHVFFCGNVRDMRDFYSAMDVFVLPSLFEGLPLVGVEAQANGLPCIFSDSVTREAGILPSVRFLPLEASDLEWAGEICGSHASDREKAAGLISAAGFSDTAFREQVKKLYEIRS